MEKTNKNILIILAVVAAGLVAFLIFWGMQNKKEIVSGLDSFAQCLASRGAVMYGAQWCSYCQKQKTDFGESFKYISYVECPEETKKCLELSIQGYPTWIFSDGAKFVGYQTMEELAKASGCEL